jgi:hypothetical protein
LGHGCEEKIAEAVALKAAAGGKTVLKEARQERGILTEGEHAIADVAGRKDVELAAQAAGAAAIVGNGDDRGDVDSRGESLQTFKDSGETGAAANCDNSER